MGNTLSSTTPRTSTAGIDSYVSELSDVRYEKSLGSGHFMKTIRCKHRDGLVVVKIFIKPDTAISLRDYVQTIKGERDLLLDVPNAFPYQRIMETERAAYLIRQHLYSNLYDRISTRPFLSMIEKKWIAFQLLAGLADAHARQVRHGDIKTENVLVTSWNWAYLVDFSGFKPSYLPEDNPGDFSFFFDTSSRRVCYLAPERFYAPGETLFSDKDGQLLPSMDIFSLGCTIAELFLEGTPLFSLSQLLRYRSGEYDPLPDLEKVEDIHIKSMLRHMIQLDPDARHTAEGYLAGWRGTAFPEFFYTFLHPYVSSLTDLATGIPTTRSTTPSTPTIPMPPSDAKIERIYHDFDKISVALGLLEGSLSSLHVHIPNFPSALVAGQGSADASDGSLLLSAIICSAMRNVLYPTSKLHAIDLLLVISMHLPDDIRLDRIVPYLMTLLEDENSLVRATALKGLMHLLSMIDSVTSPDANIFPEYILPALRGFTSDPEGFVRATYAQCIASFAEFAFKFLELAEVLKNDLHRDMDADGDVHRIMSYDTSLRDLQELIQEEVIALLIDPDPLVKRALLSEMPRLCIMFGRQKANDILLSHMITYLNGTDWQLRSAFFESIVGVGTFVGGQSLEEYILPLMVQALTDAEEFVVEKVLNSLTSLAELGLLQKPKAKELVATVLPLVCHPNTWIRYGAIAFIACAARLLPEIDVRCALYPTIKPFLKVDTPYLNEINILESLKPPISRILYDQTLTFASKTVTPWDRDRSLSPNALRMYDAHDSSEHHTHPGRISGSGGGGESNELVQRLRELGMTDEDKEKLFAMKYYISKMTQARLRKQSSEMRDQWAYPASASESSKGDSIALKNFGATPHTLFLSPSEIQKFPRSPSATVVPLGGRNFSGGLPLGGGGAGLADVGGSFKNSSLLVPRVDSNSGGAGAAGGRAHSRRDSVASSIATSFTNEEVNSNADKASLLTLNEHGKKKGDGGRNSEYGVDMYLRHLLDKKTREYFPPTIPELGPKVSLPVDFGTSAAQRAKRARPPTAQGSAFDLKAWRPAGILVAHLVEHTAPINCLKISADNVFFATCSDDRSVKIWDTQRLEKNVTNRSRLTYLGHEGSVTALTFIENTHSFASAADDGGIHVCRVECITAGTTPRYAGFQLLRTIQLVNDHAVLLDHYETETQSVLVYATYKGRICGFDLRTMTEVWAFTIPPHHGQITSFLIDKQRVYLVTGTHRGVLSIWDLRFGLKVKSFAHPSRKKVIKLAAWPGNPAGTTVAVAMQGMTNEIGLWDVDVVTCTRVWCTIPANGGGDVEQKMQATYGAGLQAAPPPELDEFPDLKSSLHGAKKPTTEPDTALNINAFICPANANFMLTGGTDRKLRFLSTDDVEASYVVVGLSENDNSPRYSSHQYGDMTFNFEYTPTHAFTSTDTSASPSRGGRQDTNPTHSRTSSSGGGRQGSSNSPARTISSSALQSGGRSTPPPSGSGGSIGSSPRRQGKDAAGGVNVVDHRDVVVDMVMTVVPYPMVITAARDGVVKVWK
ncbi:uncharacterized protein EV422DRAFT_549569 [Fimicolochytrium jonesii]|uniref:uncharacterized protein n=1 Tax=Fimicolochytrium jonesii TaxID=1396493 RepID=UPI0022FEF705|nr:uncharacterized protein EV422DRAFT_549569 [Fimicolochytrium jonesii]KAI8827076.1 hypothetical protein EV422DRAFT_549569 [Fimicolochytrium jonesii]